MLGQSELTPGFYVVALSEEQELLVIEYRKNGLVYMTENERGFCREDFDFLRKIVLEEPEPKNIGTIVSVIEYLRPDGGMSTAEITSTGIPQITTHADFLEHKRLLHATVLQDSGMDCSVILCSWTWFPE